MSGARTRCYAAITAHLAKKKSRKSCKTANFDQYWPFQAIFCHIRPFLANIGLFSLFNLCPEQELDVMQRSLPIRPPKKYRISLKMANFNHFQLFSAIFGHFLQISPTKPNFSYWLYLIKLYITLYNGAGQSAQILSSSNLAETS